jgi:O-acetylhomoserine/O-acetylserine sulfhydrylase-like pyridoxal-dependent enzyme
VHSATKFIDGQGRVMGGGGGRKDSSSRSTHSAGAPAPRSLPSTPGSCPRA